MEKKDKKLNKLWNDSQESFLYALTFNERERYSKYLTLFGSNAVFDLSQEPLQRSYESLVTEPLHTLLAGMGIMMVAKDKIEDVRWFAAVDLCVSHGYRIAIVIVIAI